MCIKAFRAYTAENLAKIKQVCDQSSLLVTCAFDHPLQRLFSEIVIWRRLSHPNVLPVLGVSPKLFPLCIVSEWMIDGNIADFTFRHPEIDRLRLVSLFFASPSTPRS